MPRAMTRHTFDAPMARHASDAMVPRLYQLVMIASVRIYDVHQRLESVTAVDIARKS
jgi:hypothetical protein